jgi:RHS repeat-associated protein
VIDGEETKYIFGNDLRLAKVTPNGTNYYHKDHLNSSVVITDANGIKIEASENYPYGLEREQEGAEVSDYKFTDQELDRSTNFYNYNARLYDPLIGRFVSADTMIPDYSDPQSLNRYSYVRNNPLVYTDPTGHTYTMEVDWELTEYSLFGNLENSYGGSFEFNPREAFVDTFSYVANDFMMLGEIMAYDSAALVVGQLSYLYTTPRDFWSMGENLVQGRYADSLESLGAMFFNLIIPRYGLGGGAGWGIYKDENTKSWTHTLGSAFVDSPLNMTDAVNYNHDREFHHLSWVSGQYAFESSSYRPSGPVGVGYKILGTIPFGIAGWFQDMGIGAQPN